jgi:hypothetical protein
VVIGAARFGAGSVLAQGAVVRADDDDAVARANVGIDFENISTAIRREGVLTD